MLRYITSVSNIFSSKSVLSTRAKSDSKNSLDYLSLEQRQALAGISFDLGSGFVSITGSAGNDVSFVTQPNADEVQVTLSGFPQQTFMTSQVTRIFFVGLEGDDFFKNETSIPSAAEGGLGNDRLIGGSGNDELYGNEGDDVLNGGAGDDLLYGGGGNDRILSGAGNDQAFGEAGNDTIFGESGNNQLHGGDGNDVIYGGFNNDQIWGGSDNDVINTGAGNNFVDGGDGNDIINSLSATSNVLLGGNGNDQIYSLTGTNRIEGGAGDDVLVGGNGIDTILGGAGNDWIRGGASNDFLEGGAGDDTLYGDDGDDQLFGGDGNDRIFGGNGNDRILGGSGNDEIHAGDGNDEIYGEDGDDLIYAGEGDDLVRAGAGNDRVYGQGGNDVLFGQDGNDLLNGGAGDDILHGQEGDDTLIGDTGNDRLYGYNGNDLLNAGAGNNSLFGGINGTNRLVGGSGKNRFLLAETATNQLFGFKSSDVQLVFRNGLRTWSNVEITVVDEAFHALHQRAGNTKILKPILTARPVVFIKEFTVASNRYGSNELATVQQNVINPLTGQVQLQTYQEHRIRLPEWNEFDTASNLNVRAEVTREIAYNWASDMAMRAAYAPLAGVFPSFSNVNGWTNSEPAPSLISEYYQSQDNQWWYFRQGKFTETYATFNPAADFAASFKFYFDPRVTAAERLFHLEKMEIIDELFARLAPF